MRHYLLYLGVTLLTLGLTLSGYSQKAEQRTFVIESQPDSPLLIRDVSATIKPANKHYSVPNLIITYYIENISKKKVKQYTFHKPAEKDSGIKDERDSLIRVEELMPGESTLQSMGVTIEGEPLVFRIKEVDFEDGTKWTAKDFNAAKAIKSARIKATVYKIDRNSKPKKILTREWGVPVFNANVWKVINAEPAIIEGVTVQTKRHQLKSERFKEIEDCPMTAEQLEEFNNEIADDLRKVEKYYRIEKFTTFEINGRIFAYEVPYGEVEVETGMTSYGSQAVYVDEDGSGYFKKRCATAWLEFLPEWVKFQAGKSK